MSVLYPNLRYNNMCYKGIALYITMGTSIHKKYLLLLWTLCCGPYGFTLGITGRDFLWLVILGFAPKNNRKDLDIYAKVNWLEV